MERDERALERIADALNRLADVAEKFYSALYPVKRPVPESVVTVVTSDEEKELEANIQGTESTLDEWRELGPREREFVEREKTEKEKK